jgi:hypothetical protein
VPVTKVPEQGLITVKVKLDGAMSEGEVPYAIPSTVTAVTRMLYEPVWLVVVVGPTT